MKRYIDILLLLLLFLWTGCNTDEPTGKINLPISICLPTSEVRSNAQVQPRRIMGDPGTQEEFLFPHHLYIVVMKQKADESWMVWEHIERTLTDEDWIAEPYTGVLPTPGDSIYRYKEEINLPLATATFGERQEFKGRVYAIASAVELTLSKSLGSVSGLDDLLAVTFDASSATTQQQLEHIYSTPYNLTDDGDYFGAFNSIAQRVPHVSLLLYHVAAKVDITWKTASSDLRLTKMKAKNLYAGNAYCFKPMENSTSDLVTSDKEITLIGSNAVGQWWEGRYYFYTIPYTTTGKAGYFPLQMEMETNDSGNNYRPTIYMKVNTTDPFVPWLRANFNIDIELHDGADTKTIDY